jgi:hypothetical protein
MAPNFRSAARLVPFLLCAVGVGVLALATIGFIGSSGFAYDYSAYDLAARRLAGGGLLYPPGTAEAYNGGSYAGLYLYAPPLAAALIPITVLAPTTAAIAWFWLRIALLAVGCALLPVRRDVRMAAFGIAAMSFPVLYDLNLGNLSIVLFALSALVWRYRERPIAPIALAAILSVRYSFALVPIGLLLRRRFRPIVWMIVAGLGIAIATLPIVGLGGWTDYVTILRSIRDISTGPHNITLATTALALGVPDGVAPVFALAGIAVALVTTGYAALRRDGETALVVSLAGTLLFAPFFHPHYLVALLVPAAFLAGRGRWWGLGLPLLGWLPGPVLPLVAIAGMVAPLLAGPVAELPAARTTDEDQLATGSSSPSRTDRAPSS